MKKFLLTLFFSWWGIAPFIASNAGSHDEKTPPDQDYTPEELTQSLNDLHQFIAADCWAWEKRDCPNHFDDVANNISTRFGKWAYCKVLCNQSFGEDQGKNFNKATLEDMLLSINNDVNERQAFVNRIHRTIYCLHTCSLDSTPHFLGAFFGSLYPVPNQKIRKAMDFIRHQKDVALLNAVIESSQKDSKQGDNHDGKAPSQDLPTRRQRLKSDIDQFLQDAPITAYVKTGLEKISNVLGSQTSSKNLETIQEIAGNMLDHYIIPRANFMKFIASMMALSTGKHGDTDALPSVTASKLSQLVVLYKTYASPDPDKSYDIHQSKLDEFFNQWDVDDDNKKKNIKANLDELAAIFADIKAAEIKLKNTKSPR